MGVSTTIPVPTLSDRGWVLLPPEKMDMLLSHFFVSQHSQTYLYPNEVANLHWVLQTNGLDIPSMLEDLQNKLEGYLTRYFDTATVSVTSDADSLDNITNSVTVKLDIIVTVDGAPFSFTEYLSATTTNISRVTGFNNYGTLGATS